MEYDNKLELIKTLNTALCYRDTSLFYSCLEKLIYIDDTTKQLADKFDITPPTLFRMIDRKRLTWDDVEDILQESNLTLHMGDK